MVWIIASFIFFTIILNVKSLKLQRFENYFEEINYKLVVWHLFWHQKCII